MMERVKNLLGNLKSETGRLDGIDGHSRKKLDDLISELEKELQTMPGSPEKLVDPLKDAISHFGTSHPGLTKIMNEIMTALSGIGI